MAETADGFDHIVVGGVRGRSAAQAARAQLAVQLRQHLVAHHRPRLVEAGDIRRGAAPGPPAHPQRAKHVDIVEIHDAAFGAKDQRPAPAPGFLEREGCEGASLGVGLRSGFWLGHFGSSPHSGLHRGFPGAVASSHFPHGEKRCLASPEARTCGRAPSFPRAVLAPGSDDCSRPSHVPCPHPPSPTGRRPNEGWRGAGRTPGLAKNGRHPGAPRGDSEPPAPALHRARPSRREAGPSATARLRVSLRQPVVVPAGGPAGATRFAPVRGR